MPGVLHSHKRASDPLNLELPTAVNQQLSLKKKKQEKKKTWVFPLGKQTVFLNHLSNPLNVPTDVLKMQPHPSPEDP